MLIASLIQASVLYLPGRLAVMGFFPKGFNTQSYWTQVVIQTTLSLVLGLVLNAWGAFLLGSLGLWTGVNAAIFPWIPALLVWLWARRSAPGPLRGFLPGWALAAILFIVVQWVPVRSEWMVGGWDPGVYTNEALRLVRTGSLQDEVHPFAQDLGETALAPVIRSFNTHTEIFPGVPIAPGTGTVCPAFPKMAVAFFAAAGRGMGAEGVLKAPLIFAILVVGLLVALALIAGLSPGQALAILILMIGQPLFIHYACTPSSEMIELLLMLTGLCALWFGATTRRGWFLVVLVGLTLAANRTSFLLFGSLGLVGLAGMDWDRTDRRKVLIRHGSLAMALWIGHSVLATSTPVAIDKLSHILPRIYRTSLALMGVSLLLDGLASGRVLREWGSRILRQKGRWILPAGWLILLAGAIGGRFMGWEIAQNFRVWVAYTGVFAVAAAAGGSVGPTLRRFPALAGLLLFLGTGLAIVLWHKHVADLYPWALKRYLTLGVPLVALGASFFCIDWARRLGREGWAWVLALILVMPAAHLSAQDWRSGEYVGVNQTLETIAGQVDPAAGVICDHFQWATPLWFAFGVSALDGHCLLENPATPEAAQFWSRVADLQREGRAIYLLSSNDSECDNWASSPGHRRLVWRSDQQSVPEIHQHSSNRDFPVRTVPHEFKLYEWHP